MLFSVALSCILESFALAFVFVAFIAVLDSVLALCGLLESSVCSISHNPFALGLSCKNKGEPLSVRT
ncbi:MAG: hypothetical protein SPJ83_06620 [Helicobacter sp.]|uniref:hypothetical protein n=1 Tax=Helicobacter sp. TaxID=218 RepID=UPI002A9131B4|nr:hypothetical protein [Helicobacter sp.]MDY5822442.1 hypothetical protein [Helicobacter sp.]